MGYCDFSCGFCATPPPATCATANAYDDTNGLNQCLSLVMAGTTTCAGNFANGQNYAGYCNHLCGINLAEASSAVGLCGDLIASGDTCASDFQTGQPNAGYCDVTCGLCDSTGVDKKALLNFIAGQQADLTTGSHPWPDFAADPQNQLPSWAQATIPCLIGWNSATQGWVGVQCDYANGRVTEVSIPNLSLTGDMAHLAGLTALVTLNLGGSSAVTGDISSLAGLTSLVSLDLSQCSAVSGSITALTGLILLTSLWLTGTSVDGSIASLTALTALAQLDLSSTGVTGRASSLSGLSALTYLDMTATQIEGSVVSVQAIAGVSGWTSFSPCSAYTCGTGFISKLSPATLAGVTTPHCCDALQICSGIVCGTGFVQGAATLNSFCANVACAPNLPADFNLCCESRTCTPPEASALAAGYLVFNTDGTTITTLGAISCADTHVQTANTPVSVRCNTGAQFVFSGCELPANDPTEAANSSSTATNSTTTVIFIQQQGNAGAGSDSSDVSGGMVAIIVMLTVILVVCMAAVFLLKKRSTKIMVMNTYNDAEDELQSLIYGDDSIGDSVSSAAAKLEALLSSAPTLVDPAADQEALVATLLREISATNTKKLQAHKLAQQKLAVRRAAKRAKLRKALLDAGADEAAVDQIVDEREALDAEEAQSALEVEAQLDAQQAEVLAKTKVAFDVAAASADEEEKVNLIAQFEADMAELRDQQEAERCSQRQGLQAKLHAHNTEVNQRHKGKLAWTTEDDAAAELLQAHVSEAEAQPSLLLAARGETHALAQAYQADVDTVMAKRQASRALAQQRLLERRKKKAEKQKSELEKAGVEAEVVTELQMERENIDQAEAEAILQLEAEADTEEAAALAKSRADLEASVASAADEETKATIKQQYEEDTRQVRSDLDDKRASKRAELQMRLAEKKAAVANQEKQFLTEHGAGEGGTAMAVLESQHTALEQDMQALVDLMRGKSELALQAAKELDELRAAQEEERVALEQERAEQAAKMAEVARAFEAQVQKVNDDDDGDPTSAKFQRRVRRMSVVMMDSMADEQEEEQAKLAITAAEKKGKLQQRLALKKKNVEEKRRQQAEQQQVQLEEEDSDDGDEEDTQAVAVKQEERSALVKPEEGKEELASFLAEEEPLVPAPPAYAPPAAVRRRSIKSIVPSKEDEEAKAELEAMLGSDAAAASPPPPMGMAPERGSRRRSEVVLDAIPADSVTGG